MGDGLWPGGQHVRDDRLHLTLGITDDFDTFPDHEAAAMRAAGDAVRGAPQPIVLDQVSAGTRSIVLRPSRTLRDLHTFERGLSRLALARRASLRRRSFSPHVTMVYRDGRAFTRLTDPVRWTADELVLIHSEVGASRHHVLGRWPLLGGGQGGAQLSLFD